MIRLPRYTVDRDAINEQVEQLMEQSKDDVLLSYHLFRGAFVGLEHEVRRLMIMVCVGALLFSLLLLGMLIYSLESLIGIADVWSSWHGALVLVVFVFAYMFFGMRVLEELCWRFFPRRGCGIICQRLKEYIELQRVGKSGAGQQNYQQLFHNLAGMDGALLRQADWRLSYVLTELGLSLIHI